MATLFSYWTKSVYSFTLCIALPCCSNATLAQLVLVRWVVNDCRLRARYVIFVHTSYTCVCGVVGAEGGEWKTYYIYIKSIRAKPNVSEYRKRITYIACCLCWYYLSVHRSNKKNIFVAPIYQHIWKQTTTLPFFCGCVVHVSAYLGDLFLFRNLRSIDRWSLWCVTTSKGTMAPPMNGSSAATGNNSSDPYVSPYMRQPKKFSFWRGIYNKDKNYILGRTPRNWGKCNGLVVNHAYRNKWSLNCIYHTFAMVNIVFAKWCKCNR